MRYLLVILAAYFLIPLVGQAQCNEDDIDPLVLLVTSFHADSTNCDGPKGSASLEITGGVLPYSVAWPDGSTEAVHTSLSIGKHEVSVTDGLGCVTTMTVNILDCLCEPQEGGQVLSLGVLSRTIDSCGVTSGAAEVLVDGGLPPYNIEWRLDENIINTSTLVTGLVAGTYTVEVTDAKGCNRSTPVIIEEEDCNCVPEEGGMPLTLAERDIHRDSTACGGPGGRINLVVTGGAPPYSFIWAQDISGSSPENLSPRHYNVTITDTRGCTIESLFLIQAADCESCNIPIEEIFDWVTNIRHEAVPDAVACGGTRGAVRLFSAKPEYGPYTYEVRRRTPSELTFTTTSDYIDNLIAGEYTIAGITNFGCIIGFHRVEIFESNCTNNAVQINVIQDINQNCERDTMEWTIPNLEIAVDIVKDPTLDEGIIRLEANNESFVQGIRYERGLGEEVDSLMFEVEEPFLSDYEYLKISLLHPNACVSHQYIRIDETVIFGQQLPLDFMLQAQSTCPAMTVDVGAPFLRRCFENTYYINYCNYGDEVAENTYVDINFDEYLTVLSSPLTFEVFDNNRYRFNLGEVESGACGNFTVAVEVSCESDLGQTHCVEAHIYPDAPCTNWTGPELQATAICQGEEVVLSIQNIGEGDMGEASNFLVTEDIIMLESQPIHLKSGEVFEYRLPANGATYRIAIPQVQGFPFSSNPSASIEGCGTNTAGTFSMGIINLFSQNDYEPYLSTDCQQNIGSFDPNDKRGLPLGFYDEHFIAPGTDLEYQIRFQNTGTDTAFNVVVLDTLDTHLDWTSVEVGSSSHPYTFDRIAENVIRFQFQDILLPDSTTNEAASHGFINFRVAQRTDIALGTSIENTAAIYFDYNDPIQTNTTWHTVGVDFISLFSPVKELISPNTTLLLSPNPAQASVQVEWQGLGQFPIELELYDMLGKLLTKRTFYSNPFTIERGNLQSGIYFFKLQHAAQSQSGKLLFVD